jgi:hypothetical protein
MELALLQDALPNRRHLLDMLFYSLGAVVEYVKENRDRQQGFRDGLAAASASASSLTLSVTWGPLKDLLADRLVGLRLPVDRERQHSVLRYMLPFPGPSLKLSRRAYRRTCS